MSGVPTPNGGVSHGFRAPDNTQHLLELGRNGSGKSQAGFFWLSLKNFNAMPWVIFDTKGDDTIEAIGEFDAVQYLKLNENPGKKGLYIVKLLPGQEEMAEAFLHRIHARNKVGLFFDEGFILGKSRALDILLTQGRSKRIPIILLSQRPAWLSRFAFSEASFFQVFQLNDERDRDTVQRFLPGDRINLDERLPPYYSTWYDVSQDRVDILKPVPPRDIILEGFRAKLQTRKHFI